MTKPKNAYEFGCLASEVYQCAVKLNEAVLRASEAGYAIEVDVNDAHTAVMLSVEHSCRPVYQENASK